MIVVNHSDGTTHTLPEDAVDHAELAGRADAIMQFTLSPVYDSPSEELTAYRRGYAWGLRARPKDAHDKQIRYAADRVMEYIQTVAHNLGTGCDQQRATGVQECFIALLIKRLEQ